MTDGTMVEQLWAGEVSFAIDVTGVELTSEQEATAAGEVVRRLMVMSAARAPAIVRLAFTHGQVEVLTRMPDGAPSTWEDDTRALLAETVLGALVP